MAPRTLPASAAEPLAAAQPGEPIQAEALLAWRRSMLALPGAGAPRAADLDWLLDLAGGLRWSQLQNLRLQQQAWLQLELPLARLEALWRRHCDSAEPLQYLIGRCAWRDLLLEVGPGVLIPRPETEWLAELALNLAPVPPMGQPLRWADLGTGSGCLAIALERGLPGGRGLAVDCSPQALAQAAANLAALAPAVELRQGQWWQAIEPWWGQLNLVVSNPPYIPSALLAGLDPVVRDHEPRLALDGGVDGLEAIRALIDGAHSGLAPGGVLVLEHHHDQSGAVLQRLQAAGLQDCRAHKDLEGVPRFASARRGPNHG